MNPNQPAGGGGGGGGEGALWQLIAPAFNRLLLEDRRGAPPRAVARGGRLLHLQDYATAARAREARRADRPAGDGPVDSPGEALVRRHGGGPPPARGNVWQRPPPGRSIPAGLAVGQSTAISTSNMFSALQSDVIFDAESEDEFPPLTRDPVGGRFRGQPTRGAVFVGRGDATSSSGQHEREQGRGATSLVGGRQVAPVSSRHHEGDATGIQPARGTIVPHSSRQHEGDATGVHVQPVRGTIAPVSSRGAGVGRVDAPLAGRQHERDATAARGATRVVIGHGTAPISTGGGGGVRRGGDLVSSRRHQRDATGVQPDRGGTRAVVGHGIAPISSRGGGGVGRGRGDAPVSRQRRGFLGLHIGGGHDFRVEPADDVGGPGPRCGRGGPPGGGGGGGGGVGRGHGNPIDAGDWLEEDDIGGGEGPDGGDEGPEDGDGGDDGGDPAPLRLPFVRCHHCRLDAMFYCPDCRNYFCEYHIWECYIPWLWPVRVPGMSLPHVQVYSQGDVPAFPGHPYMFVRAEREGDVLRYYFCRAADVFGVHTPFVPVRIRSFLMDGIWFVQTAQQESHLRRERMFPYPQFWLVVVDRPDL